MRRAGCPVVLVVLVAALAGAQPASASDIRSVTFAARYCPTYDAINANEARNNIQESLKPLGADTPYGPNDAMDPVTEATHQPLCHPLAGWKFTLGTGYQSRAVPGPWGNLSKVTGAYADAPPDSPNPVTTLTSTDLLNPSGVKTGTIEGAVTLQLTKEQILQASKGNSLWVMGGTPTDPVATPANYAFGALRCGVDNLNGDNVEWVTFPNNSVHVFCFAYYVMPPPQAGTIIVRKRLLTPAGAPDVAPQTFRFTGNLSFTPDPADPTNPQSNYFDISGGDSDAEVVAGQASFPRAAGSTWTVPRGAAARVLGDVRRGGVRVLEQHRDQEPGRSERGVHRARRGRRGHLHVHQQRRLLCRAAPEQDHHRRRRRVRFHGEPRHRNDREADDHDHQGGDPRGGLGIPAQAGDRYTITERPPRARRRTLGTRLGHLWRAASGTARADDHPGDGAQFCTFTNTFVPKGSITLRKVTLGATATTAFAISPDFGTPVTYTQSATTSTRARPRRSRRATTPRRCRSAPICSAR